MRILVLEYHSNCGKNKNMIYCADLVFGKIPPHLRYSKYPDREYKIIINNLPYYIFKDRGVSGCSISEKEIEQVVSKNFIDLL